MATYDKLLQDVDNKRQKLASANQMLAANDAQRVYTRYSKDKTSGVVVQSAEVARVLKGESGVDGLLKRFASASGMSRKDIYGMTKQYTGVDPEGGLAGMSAKQEDTSADLLVGVNLYDAGNTTRVGYNVVDLLDNVYTQLKKKHQIPALPTFGSLTSSEDKYVTGVSPADSGDYKSGKKLTSSNVKDIRDFAKKALLPYVTAFFRAFELSDEMIHAAIDAKTDTNVVKGAQLKEAVIPVDTRGRMMYALTTEGVGEALALASMGSDPVKRMMPMIDFAFATSRVGGAQEGGKKKKSSKKRSSKKRSSARKMRGGDQMSQVVQVMEGGKKKKRSSKKRSSKKRSSGRKMRGGDQEGGKKKRSSKKRSSGKRRGGAKKRSSKKRSSARRH